MKIWQIILIVLISLLLYGVIYYMNKKKKPFKRAFISMLVGVLCLIVVDVVGIYTQIHLPISAFSLCVSAVMGIPGIAAMMIIGNFM